MTVDYKAIVSVCNFHYNTALNMKTQPIYILLSLPGMLLTLQHVEGVLGDEAIQPYNVPVNDKERISIARVNGVIGVEKLIRRKPLPRPWVTV